MDSLTKPPVRHCLRCGDELADGVRFCVACGASSGGVEDALLAGAELEIQSHKRRGFWENLGYWGRYWFGGIRR
jgi:hypothetical protein